MPWEPLPACRSGAAAPAFFHGSRTRALQTSTRPARQARRGRIPRNVLEGQERPHKGPAGAAAGCLPVSRPPELLPRIRKSAAEAAEDPESLQASHGSGAGKTCPERAQGGRCSSPGVYGAGSACPHAWEACREAERASRPALMYLYICFSDTSIFWAIWAAVREVM